MSAYREGKQLLWSEYEAKKHQLWIDKISTETNKGMDQYTWNKVYKLGLQEPRFPVPAIRHTVGLVHRDIDGVLRFFRW